MTRAGRAIDGPVDALLLDAGGNHTVHIAKALVPRIVARKHGRILITGSETIKARWARNLSRPGSARH